MRHLASHLRSVPRPVWVLAAGRLVNGASSFVMLFLFLYLTGPRSLPMGVAGWISGASGLGFLLGSFTGGWFGDRFGHRRILLLTSTLSGLLTLSIPWTPSPLLAVLLPVMGYASATASVSQGALAALAVPAGERRQSVALSRAASNAGYVIGPLIGALLAAHSFTLLFVLDGLVTLAMRVVTARLLPDSPSAVATSASPPGLWRSLRLDRGLLLLLPAIVAVDIVYRQLYSTLPVFLRDNGHPVGLYAALISIGSGLILLLEIPVAIGLRRLRSLRIISAGYALMGLGFGLLFFVSYGKSAGTGIAIAAMVVITAGEILYKTTATAHVIDRAPSDDLIGRYQGLYNGAATSGTILAPPIGAFIYTHSTGLLWPICAMLAVAASLVALRSGRASAPSPDHAPTPEPART